MFSCGNKAYISGHWILPLRDKDIWVSESRAETFAFPPSLGAHQQLWEASWCLGIRAEAAASLCLPLTSPCGLHESLLVGTRPLTPIGEWTRGLA